ncbi:hypothetical protein OXYTRIMIC_075 [Oxytricha trifallax]|uniref:Uncharacterized protein n=1 Tax=Oxytricha trifallax TaxID=1172189 RepID=A0A073IAR0_9SPIT|nr:hypothetical protein OXYTRIMIC_075 [Oxytricha trifallax]
MNSSMSLSTNQAAARSNHKLDRALYQSLGIPQRKEENEEGQDKMMIVQMVCQMFFQTGSNTMNDAMIQQKEESNQYWDKQQQRPTIKSSSLQCRSNNNVKRDRYNSRKNTE